jgi:hypothetical protein
VSGVRPASPHPVQMTSSIAIGRVLMELSRNDELPMPKAVDNRLNTVRGRVINGKSLRCSPYQGPNRWRVVVADPDQRRGFGGFGGFATSDARKLR